MFIRTTKTSSGATAVQVVQYNHRKTAIVKHIGSTHNLKEASLLKKAAREWINKRTGQLSLPSIKKEKSKVFQIDKCRYLGSRHTFTYEIISKIFKLFNLDKVCSNPSFLDLVLMRIVEPSSKSYSLKLLDKYFGIKYSQTKIYRQIPTFVLLKDNVENRVVNFARKNLGFDFTLVFYDVTTLYFESFKDGELKKPGFSKDNKFNQPQVLIGLVVNHDGFPISYQVFEGNKFEGHTLIPSILSIKQRHNIKKFTVVADAAMISLDNINNLLNHNLSYIVGARLGNLKPDLIKEISSKLNRVNGSTMRVKTKHGWLICSFTNKRYYKNKNDMRKQIKKAQYVLQNPSTAIKRCKYVKSNNKRYSIHQELIKKTKLLLGIKGYCTNLGKMANDEIIKHYHNLWNVEKSFRIAKTDLKIRPIYHWKSKTIQAHILICFTALAVCKYMEIKTGKSTKKIVNILQSVTDARLLNTLTKEEIILRSEITKEVKQLLNSLSY